MNIIKKIFNRLKAERIWAKMGFYTRFVYYRRKPLLVYKPAGVEGQVSELCDLAVVSFNNSKVIEYQIRSLNKFFKFPFRYTVFDNSSKEVVSEEILANCKKYEVGYVKLPLNSTGVLRPVRFNSEGDEYVLSPLGEKLMRYGLNKNVRENEIKGTSTGLEWNVISDDSDIQVINK